MRRSKKINYKVFSETGEKEEKVDGQPEEAEIVEVGEISNLLRSISISGDISEGLDQIGEGDNMDKQRIDAIRVELSTIADDIEDFIDENEIDKNSTTSEVDCKISKIEDLRTNLSNQFAITVSSISSGSVFSSRSVFQWSKLFEHLWLYNL